MYVATLDENAKQVLRAMLHKGVASGWDLKGLTRLDGPQLLAAVRTLVDREMIATDGHLLNEDNALESFYNIRPSARQMAEFQARFSS